MSDLTVYFANQTLSGVQATQLDNQTERGETITYQLRVEDTQVSPFLTHALYAGEYDGFTGLNLREQYQDYIPPDAPIESLLIGIEPDTELSNNNITGVWGVIDQLTDQRNAPQTDLQFELSIYVLTEFNEYADHTTARSNLRV